MTEEQEERLIQSAETFSKSTEVFADAVKGIYEEAKRLSHRFWPERTERRDAITTHVPTAEDKAREDQGATDTRPVREWSTSFDDDGPIIGVREREFIEREQKQQKPGSKTGGQAG